MGLEQHPLAYLRGLNGWTQGDVARLVAANANVNMGTARQKVYRWEHGAAVPDMPSQLALARALHVDAQQVDTHPWPRWLLLAPGVTADLHTTSSAAAGNGDVASEDMDRRAFLAQGAAVTGSMMLGMAPASDRKGARVGAELVTALASSLKQLWHLDDMLGGHACLPRGQGDLLMAHTILTRNTYTAKVEQQLLALLAGFGRFTGWSAFDAGHHSAAQRYWQSALTACHAAGDMPQAASVLSNLALQSIYTDAGRDAVDQLEAARVLVDPAQLTVHAMLDCWQARAHAVRGERPQAAHMLNRADDRWERRRIEDDPAWIYWMPRPSETAEAGTAMLEIGLVDVAESILTQGLAQLPDTSAREKALYLVRAAELHLATGRLDQAEAFAGEAIAAAQLVASARVDDRVTAMVNLFPLGEPATARLREQLQETV